MNDSLDHDAMAVALQSIVDIEQQPANDLKPYIETTKSGLFYVTRQQDKDTGEVVEKRAPLSSIFHHLGGGLDEHGNHYAVLERPRHYGSDSRTIVLPLGDVGTGQGWKVLQSNGVMIYSQKSSREKLADYIQKEALQVSHAITDKGGWHHDGKAYILPSGEVITPLDSLKVIYNGDKSQAAAFATKGTLQNWNDAIGQYVTGNSRLCLAVGTALAAPLLQLLGLESGGFHIFGDSSDGKTTAAKVALSVWANPNDAKVSWNGTGYAFTNIANSRNDNFMMLDEIGEASPQAVYSMAYSVLNGTGKAQGNKDGGNRAVKKWRVLVFSTGEKSISGYVERNGRFQWQAGQETRLPSIPANAGKGLGVFDTLHSFCTGKDMAEHLNDAVLHNYGGAGVAFVEYILQHSDLVTELAKQYIDTFKATLPNMGNQAGRIANRFALVAATLMLAIDAKLLPMSHSEAMQSITQCLNDWIARSGTGNFEERRIIEQTSAFFEQAAYNRFISINKASSHEHTPPNFAGLREERGDQLPMYYVLTSVFDAEICQDFDRHKVVTVLDGIGWLIVPSGSHKTIKKRLNSEMKRYFAFKGSAPPDHEEE